MHISLTKKIVFAALFAAIAVVLKLYSWNVSNSLKVSFLYLPCFLSGIFLGPVYGFLTGVSGDLLGTLLKPNGVISPFMVFNSGLIGGIMGTVFHIKFLKNFYLKIIIGAAAVLIVVTLGLNTFAMTLPPLNYYPTFFVALATRWMQPVVVSVNTGLTIALAEVLRRTVFNNRT